jgi:tetratricopeptide (TPR) repeat protein
LTLIAGLAFNYIAFEAVGDMSASPDTTLNGVEAGISAIIAFSLGYFPSLAIRWFNRLAYGALELRKHRANELPLGLIDGIGQLHEARLRDNGIDNVQNLATAEIRDLLLNTTFSAQQIIDWVDQAVLHLYLDQSAIESFRRAGVRTLSDFQDQWKHYYYDPDGIEGLKGKEKEEEERKGRAQQLQSTPERLDMLYCAMQEGPNAHRVGEYWKNIKKETELARERLVEEHRQHVRTLIEKVDLDKGEVDEELSEQIEEALQQYQAVSEGQPVLQSADEWYRLAFWYKISGNYDEAIKAYQEVIGADPDYAKAYNDLAWLYVDETKDAENYQNALDLAKKAVKISESLDGYTEADTAMFLDTLATAQIRNRMLDEAEQTLKTIQGFGEDEVYSPTPDYIKMHLEETQELREVQSTVDSSDQGSGVPVVTAVPDEKGPQPPQENQE